MCCMECHWVLVGIINEMNCACTHNEMPEKFIENFVEAMQLFFCWRQQQQISLNFRKYYEGSFSHFKMSIPGISQRDTLDSIYPEIVQSLIVESRRHKIVGEILNHFWSIQPKQRRPNYKSDEHFREIHFIHPKSTITWSQWRVQSNTAGFRMRSIKKAYSRLLNLNRRNYRTKAHRSFS